MTEPDDIVDEWIQVRTVDLWDPTTGNFEVRKSTRFVPVKLPETYLIPGPEGPHSDNSIKVLTPDPTVYVDVRKEYEGLSEDLLQYLEEGQKSGLIVFDKERDDDPFM